MTIGEEIKQKRLAKGMGSRQLAKRIGKAPSYISQIENGRNSSPDEYTLLMIHRILDSDYTEEIVIDKTKTKSILLADDLEAKCKQDASEVYNLINNLPDRTRELLFDLLNQ